MTKIAAFCERWDSTTPLTVTLTGGGNATHVMAGLLGANPLVTVHILNLLDDECSRLKAALEANNYQIELEHEDGKPSQVGKVGIVTRSPADVIPQTDLYIVTVPAFAHEKYMKEAAPHMQPGSAVVVMVGQGGIDFCAMHAFGKKLDDITLFAFQTLPWACRTTEFGKSAMIKGVKTKLDMNVLPREHGEACRNMAVGLLGLPFFDADTKTVTAEKYPELNVLPNFLTPALMNPNAIVHPSIIFGAFHDWDGTAYTEQPLFYQGLSDFGAEQMSGVCDEILAIKEKAEQAKPGINLDLVMHMRLFVLYSYNDDIADKTSMRSSFVSNRGYKGLTHPCVKVEGGWLPDFQHRYLTEDIPYGLLVIKGIALLAGVETPYIDRQLYWCQDKMGKEYLKDGLLTGRDIGDSRAPQRFGVTSFEQVLH